MNNPLYPEKINQARSAGEIVPAGCAFFKAAVAAIQPIGLDLRNADTVGFTQCVSLGVSGKCSRRLKIK